MDLTRASILVMDAIRRADATVHGGMQGIFVVDDRAGNGQKALEAIVQALDYRIVVLDADRTNLNDLDIHESPLYQQVRFSWESEKTYVFVLRGWVSAMAKDPRIRSFQSMCTSSDGTGRAVILSDTAEGVPAGFVVCDLSAKGA